ncbi:unnamed protein product [Ectocarpus fasciculatus]
MHVSFQPKEVMGDDCDAAPRRATATATVGQSITQFFAACALGMFNCFALVVFVVMPPAMFYLAWLFPYAVVPPAVAYYFLSFDGAERKDGRPWRPFTQQSSVMRLARAYHDFQVHLDPALEPSKMTGEEAFVFGLHPHGVLSDYRILLDGVTAKNFPKLRSWRALAASVLFNFPVCRELTLWSHCIDAGRATAQYALDRGHSLFIVVGGEHEQARRILGEFGKEVLYLKSRMGFVKLALRNGVPLVPAYVFGANDTFRTSNFLRKTRLAIVKSLRIAIPLFWGRFGLPIPREVPLRVVFGAPLSFTPSGGSDGTCSAGDAATAAAAATPVATSKTDDASSRKTGEPGAAGARGLREVSDEDVRKAHGEYVSALRKLFDDNKARFGYADRELVVL